MNRTGTVTAFAGSEASVRLDPPCQPEKCLSCSAGCHGHTPTKYSGLTVKLAMPEEVPVGARVELDVELPNEAVMSFLGFGLPLLCVVLAAWLANHLYPGVDAWLVGAGTTGLAGGFACVALICRLVPYCQPKVDYIGRVEQEPNENGHS